MDKQNSKESYLREKHYNEISAASKRVFALKKNGRLPVDLLYKFKEITDGITDGMQGMSLSDVKRKVEEINKLVDSYKTTDDMNNLEDSEEHAVEIIDGILEKRSRARKCEKWFLYRSLNLRILHPGILDKVLQNTAGLSGYTDDIDEFLGFNEGVDKLEMYSRYMKHKVEIDTGCLREILEHEVDLEDLDRNYRHLDARTPIFTKKRSCKSEHMTPFCKDCGWSSHWLKPFKKRGVYIQEAKHWADDNIWYNEIKSD